MSTEIQNGTPAQCKCYSSHKLSFKMWPAEPLADSLPLSTIALVLSSHQCLKVELALGLKQMSSLVKERVHQSAKLKVTGAELSGISPLSPCYGFTIFARGEFYKVASIKLG